MEHNLIVPDNASVIGIQPTSSITAGPVAQIMPIDAQRPWYQQVLECMAGCLAPWATVGSAIAASALSGIDGIPPELRPYLIQSVLSQGQTVSYVLGLAAAGNTNAQDILKRLVSDTSTNFGQLAQNILKAGTPEFIEFVSGLIDKKVGDNLTPDEKAALITHISDTISQESNITIEAITGIVGGNTLNTLKTWANDSAKNTAELASKMLTVGTASFSNFLSNKLAVEIGSSMPKEEREFVIKYITGLLDTQSTITQDALNKVFSSNITDAVKAYAHATIENAQKTLTLASVELRDIVTAQLIEKFTDGVSEENMALIAKALAASLKGKENFSIDTLKSYLNSTVNVLEASGLLNIPAAEPHDVGVNDNAPAVDVPTVIVTGDGALPVVDAAAS